jgi:chromosome segregation ATPase
MHPADRNQPSRRVAGPAQSPDLLVLSEAAPLLGLSAQELLALLAHARLGLQSLNGEPAVAMRDLVQLRSLPELRRSRLKALSSSADDGGELETSAEFELGLLRIQYQQQNERLALLQAAVREQSDELEELHEEWALGRARIAALEATEAKLATTCVQLDAARAAYAGALEELARAEDGWRAERRRAAAQASGLEQRLESRTRELAGARRDAELAAARHGHEFTQRCGALEALQRRCAALELSERALSRYADKLEQRLARSRGGA